MPRFAKCVVVMLLVASATPILAQGVNQNNALLPGPASILEGTQEENVACAADAHRYCRDEIPNTFAVLACLKTERQKISKPCQQVLINHGQ